MFKTVTKVFVRFGGETPRMCKNLVLDDIIENKALGLKLVNHDSNNVLFESVNNYNKINLGSKIRDLIYTSIWDFKFDTEPHHNDFQKKIDIDFEIITNISYKFDE